MLLQGSVRDGVTTIQDEYAELTQWLHTKTTLYENQIRTKTLSKNFGDYLNAKTEVDARCVLYNKLKNLVEAKNSVIALAPGSWEEINRLWNKLQFQLMYWLWQLDANLPGDFGVIGKWLSEAEKLLYHDEVPTIMNEESAAIISKKLEEHKKFFARYDEIKALFDKARKSSLADKVPLDQLRNMEQRLNDVGPRAVQRRIRLKFLEHKCCLIAFLNLIENKLRLWNGKYGREDKVQQLLDQYRNFVSKNRIFQEFGKAFVDMQQVVEEYKRDGNITRNDYYEIEKFMRDTEERWKSVSSELRCCQNMLEEVIANWKRWNALSDDFEGWLCRAEEKLRAPEEERLEFFQDISTWKDKHQQLSDTANFLIATSEDSIAPELRDKLYNLTSRFETLFGQTKQYMYAGDILRNRQDYKQGADKLAKWLKSAEETLRKQPIGNSEQIRLHGRELQQLASEVEDMEELFKHNSRVIQTLIQDMSRDDVDRMMTNLKQQKEALVRVRAQIPLKLHLYHQLLIQLEALEQGQKEINNWLDEAEVQLQTLTLAGGREHIQEQLNKHRTFFSRTLYYKSMLESKNNVFQNLLKLVTADKTIDATECDKQMKQVNERFNYVTDNAQQWEKRLIDAENCWTTFKESERTITEWIYQSEVYLSERHVDSRQSLETRRTFFENANERRMNDLVSSGQDLLNTIPADDHKVVVDTVEHLQTKWTNALSQAPQHLLKQQFTLDETVFTHTIKDIEREIQLEQQALNKNEDVDSILRRNMDFFKNKGTVLQIEKCLENMKQTAAAYANYNKNDATLNNVCQSAEKQWETVAEKIEELRKTLQQIPAQWDFYHDKFNAMISWMNNVDQSLKSIVTEVGSMEEFEKERIVFQVCKQIVDFIRFILLTITNYASFCGI